MYDKTSAGNAKGCAVIYVRQSSPGQVKHNQESYRVQMGLARRAQELGWHQDDVKVIQGDLGETASLPGQRQGFDELLTMVLHREVGIILSTEVSRLARNNVDWSLLLHYCCSIGVMLADESQVYDPSRSDHSLLLGIQGALAAHEVSLLRKRMEQGLREKALRGELHQGVTLRGYVVEEGKRLRKYPDRRVQRATQKVFEEFRASTSIYELVRRLCAKGVSLPVTASGAPRREVEWTAPAYGSLREMLQNPKYAGIYAYPLRRGVSEMTEDGQIKKRVESVPREEWVVEIHQNHPAYISEEEYEANQRKMALNASRYSPPARGAPQEGRALLAGLVYCRRCGHRLSVEYQSSGTITYVCHKGVPRREGPTGGCLRFRANELEDRLSQQLLYAVSPAGVAAAERAEDLLAQDWKERRQVLEEELAHQSYQADLALRRLKAIPPEDTNAFVPLAHEYEATLLTLKEQQARLEAFDREETPLPTAEQKQELQRLGERVERAWHHPEADMKLKKQIVRTLLEHVTADIDETASECVLWIQWAGGQHTEIREPRPKPHARPKLPELTGVIETLRKVATDTDIALILNRSSLKNERGETWTSRKVSGFRRRHNIPAFDAKAKQKKGWLSQEETATYLGISPMSVHRLITRGILAAERHPGLPAVITKTRLTEKEVKTAVSRIKGHKNAPLPENPDQLSLFL